MLFHGNGYSVIVAESLETFWRQWLPWRELLEINIETFADLDKEVTLLLIKRLILDRLKASS
mgnify:CR=1 FL=1